jgi:hypothetical protein
MGRGNQERDDRVNRQRVERRFGEMKHSMERIMELTCFDTTSSSSMGKECNSTLDSFINIKP